MLIKFIHAKFNANAIANYNTFKMNTHEFNKLLGFQTGAHSPFHTSSTGSVTWDVKQSGVRTAILVAESRTHNVGVSHKCPFLSSVNFVANKNVFILCFLSYLALYFRTYHCLNSKETTTWTTYAYSDCSVLCRESCRPSRRAVRLRGGVGSGVGWEHLYSVSVIVVKCAISCYMGPRYNANLVITFMNVMPVLWPVPVSRTSVCVHVCGVGGIITLFLWEKIDRIKTAL